MEHRSYFFTIINEFVHNYPAIASCLMEGELCYKQNMSLNREVDLVLLLLLALQKHIYL